MNTTDDLKHEILYDLRYEIKKYVGMLICFNITLLVLYHIVFIY